MKRCAPHARSAVLISGLILNAVLCGCGGSTSSSATPVSSPPAAVIPPAPITGLATPQSMAVVTATNVQSAP